MRLAAAAATILLATAANTARAGAPADGKRRIAILEFRSGSAELDSIDGRVVDRLRHLTSLQILDADAARKSYGDDLDNAVVACAGEAACIAKIGARLDVREVLLVGVSEFGDVILTLQRIDVSSRQVVTRIAEALAPGIEPSAKAVDGYLKRVLPESDFLRFGTIRIDSRVRGARVAVDDKPRGLTPVPPIVLPAPASYSIRLSKPGYLDFRATVAVPPDAEVKVRPMLTRKPNDAWYKSWWVAAVAGTVVVGTATAFVLFSRDDPSDVPVTIPPF